MSWRGNSNVIFSIQFGRFATVIRLMSRFLANKWPICHLTDGFAER